ncbi:hypothetical protein QUF72_06590 [Desulfobacterales bacterium HSG2]|nr:hypothetical protein [Desulfobacterales bacterium HSG2]
MSILVVLEVLIQIYFAVHAVRTGRERWLWIIILLPGIGSLVYFFAEYVPDLQGSYKVQKFSSGVGNRLNPTKRLRHLEDQLELAPSVKNKKLLAEEYVNHGMFDKAISLYRDCMQSLYENDISMIEGLCCAYYFKKDLSNAKKYLTKLRELRPGEKRDEFDLLYARTLEDTGETDGALKSYSEVANSFSGEEARCRYALLLKKLGRTEEADELFDMILKNARLSPKFYVKAQKKWINIAKNEKR